MPVKRNQPRRRWDDDQRLPPWVIQSLGGVLTIACFVFWFFTREVSELLLAAAIGLVGGGSMKAVAQNSWRRRTETHAVTTARRSDDPGSDE